MKKVALRYALAFLAGAAVATAGGLGLRELLRDGASSDDTMLQEIQVRAGAPGPATQRPAADDDGAAGVELLPDLDQEAPTELLVVATGSEYRLAFDSAVSNVGRGPLVVEGERDGAETEMAAVQLVERTDGATRRYQSSSRLVYVSSPDHAHWHLLPFERYELRRSGDYSVVSLDPKTGFCLGDRFATSLPSPSRARATGPVFRDRCGLNDPGVTRLREGISVGHGDDYKAVLEGQYLDITRVPAGTYVLVHRVNEERGLRESSTANNAASILLRLSRPAGKPHVEVLLVCPDDDRCERDGARRSGFSG